jgi:DNA polymerase-3 subunit alpha
MNNSDNSAVVTEASFVHLHMHSQYSLLEATGEIKKLAKKAVGYGMPALALTDNGNLFGSMEFYFACQEYKINPILGLDAYLAPKGRLVKGENKSEGARDGANLPNRRLGLLAMDRAGFGNLCHLSSLGFQEGFYYKPRIDWEILEKYSSGLIALSGDHRGEVGLVFSEQGPEAALEKVRQYHALFGDRFYLEICRMGLPDLGAYEAFLKEASTITGVPLVATNNVHYIDREDAIAQEVLICIGSNRTLSDESRFRFGSNEYYFKPPEQMRRLFSDMPEACDRTLEIAERCRVKFKLKDDAGKPIYFLPTFPTSDGRSLTDEIRKLSLEGLETRFQEAKARGEEVTLEKRPDYFKRLDFELSVIERMGFNGYFLIVQDFIMWAKNQGIPVGPGRGSGAGSLVAYSLRITDLDPMTYNLIFERFLNPERISMPDFDIDFCQDRRGEVIKYVTDKYGAESVSQIITFGKLQAKAALRDVGRVLGMTFSEVDVITKLIPEKLGITLSEALEQEPKLTQLREENPKINNLFELALKVEGLNRHAGIHAAGVIISDKPLVEHCGLYKSEDGLNVVQLDMKHSEKIGLIKFDFLGLKTLTLIDDALKLIYKNRGKKFTTADISLKDPKIYELMSRGDTAGIFQFEGDGISDLIKKVKPTCFEDITAINALYRPGPMQMLDEYIGRKNGKIPLQYLFPELEDILRETYGIIVYQEQVQLIAARIASYSLGEADMLRRAMGKKIASEMAQQRSRFMDGAAKNGFDVKKSEELFDLMAKFAEYGFNKSHAAAYCVVAAQTAWLKAYYPVEFYAAMLSTEMSDTDKIVWYTKDARSHGIEVRPPHINFSDYKFSVKDETIFFGLGGIKGVGEGAVEAVIESRKAQAPKLQEPPFKTIEDFFWNVDNRRINKKVVECLIKAGGFDGFGVSRAQLMAGYTQYLDRAEHLRTERENGQASLFALADPSENLQSVTLPTAEPWTKRELLDHEKDVLGFYLSDHPLRGMSGLMKPFTNCTVSSCQKAELHKKEVIVGGLITGFRELMTQKGTRMAFGTLEDTTGSIELVIFPKSYAKFELLCRSTEPLLVKGVVEHDNGAFKMIVEQLDLLDSKIGQSQKIVFHMDQDLMERMDDLHQVLARFQGDTDLIFEVSIPEMKKQAWLKSKEPAGLKPSRGLFLDLERKVGRLDFIELMGV